MPHAATPPALRPANILDPAPPQVSAVVSEEALRRALAADREDDERASRLTTAFVSAGAKLRPLPWDSVLGFGNPRRDVRGLAGRSAQDRSDLGSVRVRRAPDPLGSLAVHGPDGSRRFGPRFGPSHAWARAKQPLRSPGAAAGTVRSYQISLRGPRGVPSGTGTCKKKKKLPVPALPRPLGNRDSFSRAPPWSLGEACFSMDNPGFRSCFWESTPRSLVRLESTAPDELSLSGISCTLRGQRASPIASVGGESSHG